MNAMVENQLEAEGALCHAIYELMVGHRYSVYDVRDAVDSLSGQLHRNAHTLRSKPFQPTPDQLADFAFRAAPASSVGI